MENILLTRSEFKESVFKRDGFRCIICGQPCIDAHHIIDRECFSDGGYYINNGVSLCSKCHIEAEKGLISCQELRDKSGITNVVLPYEFDETYEYNKWGEMLPPGNKIKYPRTYHLPFSEGVGSDDKIQYDLSFFDGKEVVVTEKKDGENTTLMTNSIYARSLDSNNHPSRNWIKGLWGGIRFDIPEFWRICGENLYAKHSIYYDNLTSYFMVFNIWNENNVCLSWDETVEWCELFKLEHVPVLYRGIFDVSKLKTLSQELNTEKQEGFVVRITDSFKFSDFNKFVIKWVRKNHVTTDEHWSEGIITKNNLTK